MMDGDVAWFVSAADKIKFEWGGGKKKKIRNKKKMFAVAEERFCEVYGFV